MIRPIAKTARTAIPAAIALLGIILVPTASPAAGEEQPDPATRWIAHSVGCFGKVRTLEADFTQEVIHRLDGHAEVARGKLQLRRGRRLRMDYESPRASLLVSDGERVRAWNPETRTVHEGPARGTLVARAIAFALDGGGSSDFATRWLGGDAAPGSGKRGVVELRPQPESELASRIVITLSGDCPSLERVTIVDRAGTATRLTLANQKLGRAIPAGRFAFTPPPGAKIVKP